MIRDLQGQAWGTAREVAERLGRDVTPGMVLRYAVRKSIQRVRVRNERTGRWEWHVPLAAIAGVELAARQEPRGRPRACRATQ